MATRRVHFVQALSTNGDGTGTAEFSADYQSSQERGYITPSAGQVLHITQIVFHMSDNGVFTRTGFGAGAALTNGIVLSSVVSGNTYTYTTIKINDDIPHAFSDYRITEWNATEDTVTAYFNAFTYNGSPITLQSGDSVNMYVNDDLSGIAELLCNVHGYMDIEV